jgi:hypothetical protein
MIETVQIILLVVIVIFAILAIILGIQAFIILKEFRKTLRKANTVLDSAKHISDNVNGPLSTIATLTSSLKSTSMMTVLNLIKGIIGNEDDERRRRD